MNGKELKELSVLDQCKQVYGQAVRRELKQRIVPVLETILMEHLNMYGSVQLNVQKGHLISVEVRVSHNAMGVEQLLAGR